MSQVGKAEAANLLKRAEAGQEAGSIISAHKQFDLLASSTHSSTHRACVHARAGKSVERVCALCACACAPRDIGTSRVKG